MAGKFVNVRTYGRDSKDKASLAFDDMLSGKVTTTETTLGRSSYRNARLKTNEVEEPKRRTRSNSDPFSFDSDEDTGKSPKKGTQTPTKSSKLRGTTSASPPKVFYGNKKQNLTDKRISVTKIVAQKGSKGLITTGKVNKNGNSTKTMTSLRSTGNKKQLSIFDSIPRKPSTRSSDDAELATDKNKKTSKYSFLNRKREQGKKSSIDDNEGTDRTTRSSPVKNNQNQSSLSYLNDHNSEDKETLSPSKYSTMSCQKSKSNEQSTRGQTRNSKNSPVKSIPGSKNTLSGSQKSSLLDDEKSDHDTDTDMVSSDEEPVFFNKGRVTKTFSKQDSLSSVTSLQSTEPTSPIKVDHTYSIDSIDDEKSPVKLRPDHSYTKRKADSTRNTSSPKKSRLLIQPIEEREISVKKPVVTSPSVVKNKVFRQMDLDAKEKPQAKAIVYAKSPKKGSTPTKAAYNPRTWRNAAANVEASKPALEQSQSSSSQGSVAASFEADFSTEPPLLKRSVTWPRKTWYQTPVTSLKVNRDYKELFTVVRNVKEAHECQEHGEAQEFEDDLQYIMDGMHDTQATPVRCLSTISLASKCTMPAFRMHLRAQSSLTKIFSLLHDAASKSTLSLCTALVMYMMSRDRLNMDLDKGSLQLMLQLLSVTIHKQKSPTKKKSSDDTEYERTKQKVRSICEQLQKDGGAKELNLDLISTGYLAMESLLSLTSKKAGDWFTDDLRELKGLDHIIDDVYNSIDSFIDDGPQDLDHESVEKLSKVDRWLKVLENVTFMSNENQVYLAAYKDSYLIKAVCRALKICQGCISVYPIHEGSSSDTGKVILECMLAILRVLLNLTHDNEFACVTVGNQDDLINTSLLCVLQSPQYVPLKERFDILVLGLGLLINLVEHCELNRRRLISAETVSSYDSISQEDNLEAPEAIVQLFLQRIEAAQRLEEEEQISEDSSQTESGHNESGEWHESQDGMEWIGKISRKEKTATTQQSSQEEVDLTEVLHKAGKHMEDSIVASYIALLIGCLIQNNKYHIDRVRACLPDGSFAPLVKILHKFLGFMSLTKAVENTGGSSIVRIIDILQAA